MNAFLKFWGGDEVYYKKYNLKREFVMKIWKRIASLVFAILLTMGCLSTTVLAESEGGTGKYKVQITVQEPLTKVSLTLTGRSGQGTFTTSMDSLKSYDDISITDIPEGSYTYTLLGTNAKGVNVKGSGYAFCNNVMASDGVYKDTVSNLVENVKSNVTFRLNLTNPYPAKNGQNYPFYITSPNGQIDAKLVAADGTEYPMTQGSTGYLGASVPANAPYKLVLKGWSYGAIDGGTVDTTVKYFIQYNESGAALSYNLKESYLANDRIYSPKLDKYTFKEEQPTDRKTVTVTLMGEEVAGCTVTIKTPDRVTLEAITDENGVASFDMPLVLNDKGSYTITATDTSGLKKTKTIKSLESNTDIALPENVFKLHQQVYIGDKLISESAKFVPLRSGNKYDVYAPAAFLGIAKCVSVTAEGNDISVSNITSEYDNYGHAEIQAELKQKQEVLLKYAYEYTDADQKYKVNVKECYVDNAGKEVLSEGFQKEYSAGDSVTILAQSSADSAYFKKDIDGYTDGAWFQTTNQVAGGLDKSVVGPLEQKMSTTNVNFDMPHGDVDVIITYGYTDTYVEYLANAQDAVGSMSTTWASHKESVSVSENTYSRNGYIFLNWNTKEDGSGDTYNPNDSLKLKSGGVSLYAQWGKLYTVTYTDGVENKEVFDDQIIGGLLAGDETPQFDGVPTRDGYTFKGWSPNVEATVSGDAVYTAQWEKVSPDKKDNTATGTPQTGDTTNLALWFALLGLSLFCVFATFTYRKRQTK